MFNTKVYKGIQTGLIIAAGLLCIVHTVQAQPVWPEVEREHKPWTRWWWMGSAVDEQNLSRQMELLSQANIGGVEITPIYGVAGHEDQFTDFLSPEWMDLLEHTLSEGRRLDLGIDMATGTGWPFGGPWIQEDEASRRLYYKTYEVKAGRQLSERISYTQEAYLRSIGNTIYELHGFLKAEGEEPEGTVDNPLRKPHSEPLAISDIRQPLSSNKNLQELAIEQVRFEKELPLATLMAYSEEGVLDLTGQVDENGRLDWTAPEGEWTLYAVFSGWHGKTVERAAPGGEGFVIDHFSERALQRYLAAFDRALADRDIRSLRSFFNDSYEVDDAEGEANWTPRFFSEFEQRRGYDLREHLPSLLGEKDTDTRRRVLTDYRETISDLLLEAFTQKWDSWAESNGALIRNQAHGSPANILDLYAASDIPETEGTDIIRAKMASSAANVTGKRLASAEAATWLNEHFSSSLSDVKRALDLYFVSGINHIVYHGTAYSPEAEEWPGWLFYAAVHFNERNPLWNHFADFNNYVTRVQSFLQSGQPDNDILLYYPIHDQWAEPGRGLLRHFDGELGEELSGTLLKKAAELMVERGYAFDFISDRQLKEVTFSDGGLKAGGVARQTIVVPQSRYLPLETFTKLTELAREGATVIAYGGLPEDVPGLFDLNERRRRYGTIASDIQFNKTSQAGIEEARFGEGYFLRGESIEDLLNYAGALRESMADSGLQFVRRSHDSGQLYFITNWSKERVDGWVPLSAEAASAALFDPMQGEAGYAQIRTGPNGGLEIYLQLSPGESCIVKTYDTGRREASYRYIEPAGEPHALKGAWTLEFISGGPDLPPNVTTENLKSWTAFGGAAYQSFSGTGSYTIHFEQPAGTSGGWLLNLGDVYESAAAWLNGKELGTLIGPEYEIYISSEWLRANNELVVEVSNLMANRIADHERNGQIWKKFYNVNFPAWLRENRNEQGLFDASGWKPRPSGLAGPVTLTPVELMEW